MATLTVRTPSRRDWLKLGQVRQRRVSMSPPWGAHAASNGALGNVSMALAGLFSSKDLLVASVDDELCAVAVFERGDETYRWNLCALVAGSPRVDATDEVAIELWVALLEEGVKAAGRAGARRIFAFTEVDDVGYESLLEAGFSGYSRYSVLRGRFKSGLRESVPVREQHDSDLWSIHQLYNRTTPRPVQFAEALTSDAWATGPDSRLPFRSPKRVGVVAPTEDGIGAACHIELGASRPVVTLLCDEHLAHAIPSIVADSLEFASIRGDVDVVIPGYQQDLMRPFLAAGFAVRDEVIGMVRHTTVPVAKELVPGEVLSLSDARAAVTAPYQGLSLLDRSGKLREGA